MSRQGRGMGIPREGTDELEPVGQRRAAPVARPQTQEHAPARDRAPDQPQPHRNPLTMGLAVTAIVGGKAKGVLIDRTRAAFAFNHARAQGKTGKWALELASGRLTNDVVPITGGTVSAFGRTITEHGWKRSYQASNAIGMALLGVSLLYGFPNLYEGIKDGGGPEGMVEMQSGRTGVLATVGNVVSIAAMGVALRRAPAGNASSKLASVLADPIHSSAPLVLLRIGVSVPVLANELGYFDFLDKGDERSPLETAHATSAKIVDKVTPG